MFKKIFYFVCVIIQYDALLFCQNYQISQYNCIPVSNNIYLVAGRLGNIGVCLDNDGILLVDTKDESVIDIVLKEISKLSEKSIKYVLNTHWHSDHVGGNERLAAQKGTTIIAHENVYKRMKTEQYMEFLNMRIPPFPEQSLPQNTFKNDTTIHFNNEKVKIIHFGPGHTDGDAFE